MCSDFFKYIYNLLAFSERNVHVQYYDGSVFSISWHCLKEIDFLLRVQGKQNILFP